MTHIRYIMTPIWIIWVLGAILIATPIAIYYSNRAVEREAKRKAEKKSYEYDPKNWDTLNR